MDLIVTNKNILTESYNTRIHDFIDVAIEAAAQKDGEFNLEVASMLLNFAYAIIPDNIRKIADKDIIRMLQQAAYLCRDSNGDFSKSNIIETMKDLNYVKDNYRRTYNFQQKQCENYLMKKYFDKITEGKNLYDAQVVYDILETANLDFKTLTAEIQDYDNLLFVIANIPPEQNPEVYQKIIEKLNSLESVDYNITDSYDMSFLGKVLCSENLQLLKVISHPLNAPLEYCPELDNMYQGIQNQEFKNFVDNHLELRFPLLEDAVRDCSKKALKKLLPQLSSPLCHRKKVLNDLWKIALGTKDNDFCLYFAKKFSKDLPDSIINDLNKIN